MKIGDIVTAPYKTGKYIAEIVEVSEPRSLIKVLAVLRHPTQGDLHNPKQVDVPFFHQRKALAFNEKTWVQSNAIQPHEGNVPGYQESLKETLESKMEELRDKDDPWSERSLQQLEDLQKDYFKS